MQRRDALKVLSTLALTPWLPGCASQPDPLVRGDYQAVGSRLSPWLEQEMSRLDVVGLSIALLDDQRLVWAQGFGHVDRGGQRPARADTCYRAGSIGKLFTALAALQIAEAGKLDLDAPLQSLLPEFRLRAHSGEEGSITPRLILTHHAGLPSDYQEGMWGDRVARHDILLPLLAEEYRAAPLGLAHAYSNVGFSLLGTAIERLAGVPFEQHLADQVHIPLGMANSAFAARPRADTSLAYDAKGRLGAEKALRDIPAGGLVSTAPELLQLARMLFNGGELERRRLLSNAGIQEMVRPQHPECALDFDLDIALAWHFAPGYVQAGGPVLFHNGGTLHHRAVLMLLPQHKLAVAVLANSNGAQELVLAAAGRALTLMLEARTGIPPSESDPGNQPADSRHPPAPAAAFPDHYVSEIGHARVEEGGGTLIVEVNGKRLKLTPRANGYRVLECRMFGLFPIGIGQLGQYQFTRQRVAGREVLVARDNSGSFYLAGERIEAQPIPAAWRPWLGEYEYAGQDEMIHDELARASLHLIIEDHLLCAELVSDAGRQRIPLVPIDDRLARLASIGRGNGDTVRVDGDGLRHAGMLFRRKTAA